MPLPVIRLQYFNVAVCATSSPAAAISCLCQPLLPSLVLLVTLICHSHSCLLLAAAVDAIVSILPALSSLLICQCCSHCHFSASATSCCQHHLSSVVAILEISHLLLPRPPSPPLLLSLQQPLPIVHCCHRQSSAASV
jgi:hypothetical protein